VICNRGDTDNGKRKRGVEANENHRSDAGTCLGLDPSWVSNRHRKPLVIDCEEFEEETGAVNFEIKLSEAEETVGSSLSMLAGSLSMLTVHCPYWQSTIHVGSSLAMLAVHGQFALRVGSTPSTWQFTVHVGSSLSMLAVHCQCWQFPDEMPLMLFPVS
jgi:hypothetical protein